MKSTTVQRNRTHVRSHIPYPNAATREEMLHKVLNTLICGVVGAGLAACTLLLLAIL